MKAKKRIKLVETKEEMQIKCQQPRKTPRDLLLPPFRPLHPQPRLPVLSPGALSRHKEKALSSSQEPKYFKVHAFLNYTRYFYWMLAKSTPSKLLSRAVQSPVASSVDPEMWPWLCPPLAGDLVNCSNAKWTILRVELIQVLFGMNWRSWFSAPYSSSPKSMPCRVVESVCWFTQSTTPKFSPHLLCSLYKESWNNLLDPYVYPKHSLETTSVGRPRLSTDSRTYLLL